MDVLDRTEIDAAAEGVGPGGLDAAAGVDIGFEVEIGDVVPKLLVGQLENGVGRDRVRMGAGEVRRFGQGIEVGALENVGPGGADRDPGQGRYPGLIDGTGEIIPTALNIDLCEPML